MFKNIVIGLDGSPESERALPLAIELAERDGGSIVAVHVREMLVSRGGHQTLNPAEEETEAAVRQRVEELSSAGTAIRLAVVSAKAGGPAHVLADLARAEHADVIVIGTRGHRQIAGLLVGSTTQRLLHIAPCPVYVVPPAVRDDAQVDLEQSSAAAG